MVKSAVEFWWKMLLAIFPQQKKLENLLPNFAASSPPISPKTSPTSLWKLLVLTYVETWAFNLQRISIAKSLRFPNALFPADISENQHLGSVCALRFAPESALTIENQRNVCRGLM